MSDEGSASPPTEVPTEVEEKKTPQPKRKKSIPQKVFAFFASYGLACTVMAFLCLLTFVGTIDMVRLGLHETSNRYFESIFAYIEFGSDPELEAKTGNGGGFKLWIPGGMLLMTLLFFNLLCGALIRARKSWKRPGMLIAHSGMLFMLIAGLVTFMTMREGNMPLWEISEIGAEFEPAIGGAKVTAVEEKSAGKKAGLEVGDLLVAVTAPGGDGLLNTKDDSTDTITDYRPTEYGLAAEQFTRGKAGDRLNVEIKRGEEEKTLEVVFSGESGDESFNLTDWTLEIGEYTGSNLPKKVMVVQPELLSPLLKDGAKRAFFSEALPFEIEISNYLRNCAPYQSTPETPSAAVVDGLYLRNLVPDSREEFNSRGANIVIRPKGGGEPIVESLLWGGPPGTVDTTPLTVEVDGKRWAVNLTKERTTLPFKIRLEKFRKIDHPGTNKVKEFTSNVTKFDPGTPVESGEASLIEMNKPLRSDGFTVYQAGWGPPTAQDGDLLYTSLVIAQNPADQWPKYACYVVSVGLLIHFIQKLYFYINRMVRKRRRIQEAIAANNVAK